MQVNNSRLNNGVNGITQTLGNVSPGRDTHAQQVGPDRYPVTALKNKTELKVGTWNVRTLFQSGKLENLKKETVRCNINIMGVSEVRWKGAGKITTDKHTFVYSGGEVHERGVGMLIDQATAKYMMGYWALSDRVMLVKFRGKPFDISVIQVYAPTTDADSDEIDSFYEKVDAAMSQCKSQDVVLVMGDFNAKVGEGKEEDIVGPHGLGTRNERGEMLVNWCKGNDLIITNTWFLNHNRRKYTWVSPNSNTRNQIDYIMINKRFRNAVKQSNSYPGADINSHHNLVVAKVKIRLRKLQKTKQQAKFQLTKLREDHNVRSEFQLKVSKRFEKLQKFETEEVEE